jgi:uncharacterized repeat protein (TIGR03806 family)
MRRAMLAACLVLCLAAAASARAIYYAPVNQAAILAEQPPALLADYRFFTDASARDPNIGVTSYDLNTALYADGALKFRYLYLPPGTQAAYDSDGVFAFPVGAALIKSFAYAADMRAPADNVRLLETRLLIRRAEGWIALPYVWNQAQTEARLSLIGARIPVSFTDEQGEAVALDWAVPNRNQCKGCHDSAGLIAPIGPSARNLNREDQLARWRDLGLLYAVPADAPRVPDAYASGPVDARARAYLDVNCAHCHNPVGPAHTSGLDLRWSQNEPARWGVNKRPVAAGRGSAGYSFSIEPGHPERSILLHRMQSVDPGVMMPELGRQLADQRALTLVRDWIAGMDAEGRTRD